MFVYLSFSGTEVYVPTAVSVEVVEERLTLRNHDGEVAAVFPATSVSLYSPCRLPSPHEADAEAIQ